MKRSFRFLLIAGFLVTTPIVLMAQQPPHPNGGVNGPGGGPVGGGAPIGTGVTLMIVLGAFYGASKLYTVKNITSISK